MKYLAMLKKSENTYPEPQPKLPKHPFDSNDSEGGTQISEKEGSVQDTTLPRVSTVQVDWDGEITAVIREFDEAGVIVTDAAPEIRRETLALEDEITEAANDQDEPRFRKSLHRWRLAWLRSLH